MIKSLKSIKKYPNQSLIGIHLHMAIVSEEARPYSKVLKKSWQRLADHLHSVKSRINKILSKFPLTYFKHNTKPARPTRSSVYKSIPQTH